MHIRKNVSWRFRRGSVNGSVEIMVDPDGKLLMTAAAGSQISEVLERAFLRFGVPERIITHGGPDFTSRSFGNLLVQYHVEHRVEVPR